MEVQAPGADPEPIDDPGPEVVDIASTPQQVEVRILRDVYEAARDRAKAQGQPLSAVARFVLYQVAAETPDDAQAPEGRPPLREYGQPRERLRFDVPIGKYIPARDAIVKGGRSVSQAVEDGMARYAETGLL